MDINTANTTPIPTNSTVNKIEPISSHTTILPEEPRTSTATTDSINLSQTAINISRAETISTIEIENPQENIDNITNDIQHSPELALTTQSNQLSSATVQSLIG